MPFVKPKRKNPETVRREEPVKQSGGEHRLQSVDDLFDIAYKNYKTQNQQSSMKRGDFRRNVWGKDEIFEYLNEEQIRYYKAYLNSKEIGSISKEVPTLEEEVTEDPSKTKTSHEKMGNIASFPSKTNNQFPIDEPADHKRYSSEQAIQEKDLNDTPAIITHSSGGSGISEVEPAYDDSFLADVPDFLSELEERSEEDEMRDLMNAAGREEFYEAEENEDNTYPESDAMDRSGFSERENEYDSEVEQEEDYLADEDSPNAYRGTSDEIECDHLTDDADTVADQELDVASSSDAFEDDNALRKLESEPEKEPDAQAGAETVQFHGIFGLEGMMGRLRKSMYLDEADASLDDEILQLNAREVFEQLIRLEGCARKVGTICDIAEQVFGNESYTEESSEPTKERLKEIIAHAAETIGCLMHFPCNSNEIDLWNNEIADGLGLTEDEKGMNLFPRQEVHQQYIIRHSIKQNGQYEDMYYLVCGDYTQICRTLFQFEFFCSARQTDKLGAFLDMSGYQWELLEYLKDMEISEDIIIENGKVTLNS